MCGLGQWLCQVVPGLKPSFSGNFVVFTEDILSQKNCALTDRLPFREEVRVTKVTYYK